MDGDLLGGILFVGVVVAGLVAIPWMVTRNAPPPAGVDEPEPGYLAHVEDLLEDDPPTVSRTYHGTGEQIQFFRTQEAVGFADAGYYPVSEGFTPGSHGTGIWLIAVLLLFAFGIGLILIIVLLASKPPGYLTVIYERRATAGERAGPANDRVPDVKPALAHLESLRSEGIVTDTEYATKRAEILARL